MWSIVHKRVDIVNKPSAGGAIQRVVQLNEEQEHAFSRDEIINMLDNAMGITASNR